LRVGIHGKVAIQNLTSEEEATKESGRHNSGGNVHEDGNGGR